MSCYGAVPPWHMSTMEQCHPVGQCPQPPTPPWHMGLKHYRAMPPLSRGARPPGAGAPTCKAEVEGAAGSAMAVAHLAGQRPRRPPAHTQQPQAVLVVVRHHHLARAFLLPQHLPAPAGTPAAASRPHRQPQTHHPIDSSHLTAPWPPPDPQTALAPAPTPQPPQTARTALLALPPDWLPTLSTPLTAPPPPKKSTPRMQLCRALDMNLGCMPSSAPRKDPHPPQAPRGAGAGAPLCVPCGAMLGMGQATGTAPCPTSSR